MITRRDLIKHGALGVGLVGLPQVALAAAPQGLDAMLLDTRFVADLPAGYGGVQVLRFTGDVTAVWVDQLDRRWRQPGHVLGGITGSDALFVLEVLAVQHGRRVVSRTPLGDVRGDGLTPLSWTIAPHHPSVIA
jgi:hypothetical protein